MPEEMEMMDDKKLVKKAISDQRAFATLISRYEKKMSRYIKRLGIQNKEDQADVLQNVFLKLYKNLNNFDHSLTFSTWLYRIAHNEAISWYRHQSVRPEGHLIVDSDEIISFLLNEGDSVETKFDRQVEAKAINDALFAIDEKYREVIILRFFEQREYEEISDILEIPVSSVGTLLFRGKKQLKTVLNRRNLRI